MSDPGWHLARGYRFHGSHCGIRPDPDRKDLALLISDEPASAAGVFTQARIVAAPVQVCRERVPRGDCRGVVVCSGNANACTGPQGLADARQMAAAAAEAVGARAEQVLVCSTGVIGRPLPMPEIIPGIHAGALNLHPTAAALEDAAHAILTTDTRIKVVTRAVEIAGVEVRLTGLAKGAAMIGPNLATMLAFVLTDAPVQPDDLQRVLRRAVNQSFNCISVEGHTSTNDTVLLFANGTAEDSSRGGADPLRGPDLDAYAAAVNAVCGSLARAIADDGEGSTHLITISVEGLRTEAEARAIAKAVADSPLVKTAIYGGDPNWGRIVSAAGYAGVAFDEADLSCWIGPHLLYERGVPLPFEPEIVSAYLKSRRDIELRLRFTLGSAGCRFWTCDLTEQYVHLNADYTT